MAADVTLRASQIKKVWDLNCFQTCTRLFPGQDIHSSAAEGAVSVDLGAVQDLLELFVSWLLGFHSYLKDKIGKSSCSHCHLISTDCHLTTSLQLDLTAVPLGW